MPQLGGIVQKANADLGSIPGTYMVPQAPAGVIKVRESTGNFQCGHKTGKKIPIVKGYE